MCITTLLTATFGYVTRTRHLMVLRGYAKKNIYNLEVSWTRCQLQAITQSSVPFFTALIFKTFIGTGCIGRRK